jgi:hypothetical protein
MFLHNFPHGTACAGADWRTLGFFVFNKKTVVLMNSYDIICLSVNCILTIFACHRKNGNYAKSRRN